MSAFHRSTPHKPRMSFEGDSKRDGVMTRIRVGSNFVSTNCRAFLLAEGYPAEHYLINHETPFPPGIHRSLILVGEMDWHPKSNILDRKTPLLAGYPSANISKQKVRHVRLSGLLQPRIGEIRSPPLCLLHAS